MMNNSILGAVNKEQGVLATQNLQKLKEIATLLKASQNPMELIALAAQRNPLMKQLQDTLNQYGGNSDLAFTETCKRYGINPNEVMSSLQGII